MKSKIDIIVNREKYKKTIKMIDEILSIQPKNLTELIFQKYIEFGGAANTAEYLNNAGYKAEGVKGPRNYNSTDVTELIENEADYSKVDERILFVALGLKKKHSQYSNWQSRLLKLSEEYINNFGA